MTVRVRRGLPSLRNRRLLREVHRSLRALKSRADFRVCHYSVQRDHVHWLVEARDADALGRGMKALGIRLAKAINRVFGRSGRVFADRYHLHILRTPREVRAALAYVLRNAQKHARKLGVRARQRLDPASSARWFDGWRDVAPDRLAPGLISAPSTWLLRRGWRRYGLIPLRS